MTPSRDTASPINSSVAPGAKPSVRSGIVESPDKPLPGPLKPVPAPVARPGFEPRRGIEMPNLSRKGERTPMASDKSEKKLIVGRDISLNGQISSCDRLVVEGRVEAELNDCHTIEIAEAGTFKGAAEIESAEVSGHYEGSLTVRENLLIHSTGHVSGTIRYGRLQIEQGGEINGDVKSLGTKTEKSTRREPVTPSHAGASQAAVGAGED